MDLEFDDGATLFIFSPTDFKVSTNRKLNINKSLNVTVYGVSSQFLRKHSFILAALKIYLTYS